MNDLANLVDKYKYACCDDRKNTTRCFDKDCMSMARADYDQETVVFWLDETQEENPKGWLDIPRRLIDQVNHTLQYE
jgi:hypothetical protein